MTDYKWEIKQRRKQKDLFLNYRNVQMGDGNSTQIDSLRTQQSKYDVISSLIYSLLHIKSTISISYHCFFSFCSNAGWYRWRLQYVNNGIDSGVRSPWECGKLKRFIGIEMLLSTDNFTHKSLSFGILIYEFFSSQFSPKIQITYEYYIWKYKHKSIEISATYIDKFQMNISIIMKQNITEEILINEAHWISITREVFFCHMEGWNQ